MPSPSFLPTIQGMSENMIDQAIQWAQKVSPVYKEKLRSLEELRSQGQYVDDKEFDAVFILANMSLDDLKREYIHQKGLSPKNTVHEKDFYHFMAETSIRTSEEVLLSQIVKKRKVEYSEFFKLNPKNPYLNFLLTQLIQDEIQINRFRQDISLNEASATFSDAQKEEKSRESLDTIMKLNKSMFEIGKYLSQVRNEEVEKENKQQETEAAVEKWGLNFQDLLGKLEDDPRIALANQIQDRKREEYLNEISDDSTTPDTSQ